MSRPTALARANFKKYAEITNPLASSLTKRQSENDRNTDTREPANNHGKGYEEDEDEEEEDPFGLGSIMARGQPQPTRPEEEDEEEEDPFGLGAIMDTQKGSGATTSPSADRSGKEKNDSRSSTSAHELSTGKRDADGGAGDGASGGASDGVSSRKARKITTSTTTTGGYFAGTAASIHPEDGRSVSQSTATAAEGAAAAAANSEAERRPYLQADSFEGARMGYVFQKGRLGLGYYADKTFSAGAGAGAGCGSGGEKRHAVGGIDDAVGGIGDNSSSVSGNGGSGGRRTGEGGGPSARFGGSGLKDGDKSGSAAAAAAAAPATGGKRPPLDVPAAVQKLKALLLKPKKAAKAASLMANLMEAEMRPENARLFFRALKPLASDPTGEAALAAGEGGARAFRLLVERGSGCIGGGSADGVRAVTWELLFGLRHDVKTDDSFQFARAVKRLRQAIEALGDATGTINSIDGTAAGVDGGTEEAVGGGGGVISLPLERKRAVILIMKEAFKSYHLAWARSSIEPAFKAAADRRRLFPEGEMRDALDGFTDTITKRQRNPGGAMAPPSRSVRAHNSTAHPMLNKRADIIR